MSEPLFGVEDPGDDGDNQFDPDSATAQLKEVRNWGKTLERKVKAQEKDLKELEELREFKKGYEVEVRSAAAAKVFESLGLPPAQARLFVAQSQEVSEDAVRKFATDYGLVAAEVPAGGSGENSPGGQAGGTPAPQGYHPVVGQGSEGFVDGSTFTPEDIEKLLASGQSDRVSELVSKGKVKFEKLDEEYGYIK